MGVLCMSMSQFTRDLSCRLVGYELFIVKLEKRFETGNE